ncbi:MAG: hypothetical protein ILP16_09660 [Spirochaetales bacterium]|nr:hypothetical protein [Spirochaetales bacterium]
MKCVLCNKILSDDEEKFYYHPENKTPEESVCCASCYFRKLSNLQLGREYYPYIQNPDYVLPDDILIFQGLDEAIRKVQGRYGISNWKLKECIQVLASHFDELYKINKAYGSIEDK